MTGEQGQRHGAALGIRQAEEYVCWMLPLPLPLLLLPLPLLPLPLLLHAPSPAVPAEPLRPEVTLCATLTRDMLLLPLLPLMLLLAPSSAVPATCNAAEEDRKERRRRLGKPEELTEEEKVGGRGSVSPLGTWIR